MSYHDPFTAELALKARKEIADYVAAGKDDRARIRVRKKPFFLTLTVQVYL